MIAFLEPLPIGNAVRVLLAPAAGATATRVLRKTADTISGPDDAGAARVYEGDERSFVDVQTLANGTPYYYQAFDRIAGNWVASPSASATPAAAGQLISPDPLELVRSRLEAALKTDVAAGRLKHNSGYIPCYSAPPEAGNIQWPVVSVHLRRDAPSVRAIGEVIEPDELLDDEVFSSEGWIAGVQLEIVGWSLNPDERIAVRKAIRRAIIGNLPVFADKGVDQVEVAFSDVEDFESYGNPVYQTVCDFSCNAAVIFAGMHSAAHEITVLPQAA